MKKRRKLNYKKVIIGYFLITIISIIILLCLPNTPKWNQLWCFGFLTGITLFTCLIEGGDK